MRPSLEVADIFARFGGAYRQAHKGHLSLSQLKVMSAIAVLQDRHPWRSC